MEREDPERGFSDLESPLAEPPGAADSEGECLNADHVRNVAFARPPFGKRGYNEDEVDAFLDVIEAALRDPAVSTLTSERVRSVAFGKPPIGRRGYDEGEVDAFLYLVEEHFRSQQRRSSASAPIAPLRTRHAAGESRGRRIQP